MNHGNEQAVFRQVAFPVSTFDYLKQFQRDYQTKYGTNLTNNQALAIILKEHKQFNNVESEEQYGGQFSGSKATP
jgi:outer membrane protein assembly factor BamE (lipoprotein component of BamABCDE complex)